MFTAETTRHDFRLNITCELANNTESFKIKIVCAGKAEDCHIQRSWTVRNTTMLSFVNVLIYSSFYVAGKQLHRGFHIVFEYRFKHQNQHEVHSNIHKLVKHVRADSSSFSIIISLNSMNSLNLVYSVMSLIEEGHHKLKVHHHKNEFKAKNAEHSQYSDNSMVLSAVTIKKYRDHCILPTKKKHTEKVFQKYIISMKI